jgi:hypothetical protein
MIAVEYAKLIRESLPYFQGSLHPEQVETLRAFFIIELKLRKLLDSGASNLFFF